MKHTFTGHAAPVLDVAFSPDGRTLASGSGSRYHDMDHTVRLWDATTWTHKRTLTGHTASVRSIAFNPDGKTLASASEDGTVLLWKVD